LKLNPECVSNALFESFEIAIVAIAEVCIRLHQYIDQLVCFTGECTERTHHKGFEGSAKLAAYLIVPFVLPLLTGE